MTPSPQGAQRRLDATTYPPRARRVTAALGQYVVRHRAQLMLAVSILAPLVLVLGLVPFRDTFASPAAALVMLAVVVAVAVAGSRVDGVVASLSAAVCFDVLLTRPYERLTISHRADVETTVALLVVGAIVTEVAARNRHHLHDSSESSRLVTMLHDLVERAARGDTALEVSARATDMLNELLSLRSCRYEPLAPEPPLARIVSNGEVIHVGLPWPVHEIGIPGPEAEITVQWHDQRLGSFVLTPTPGQPVSRERRVAAVALVDVVAAAISHER